MNSFYKPQWNDFAELVEFLGFEKEISLSTFILNRLDSNWESIVGKGFSPFTKPVLYKEGILTILVIHDSYRMELNFIKELIFKNIERTLGARYIAKLNYRVGEVKRNKQTEKKTIPTTEGKENLIQILDRIEEKETKEKLKELILLFPSQK